MPKRSRTQQTTEEPHIKRRREAVKILGEDKVAQIEALQDHMFDRTVSQLVRDEQLKTGVGGTELTEQHLARFARKYHKNKDNRFIRNALADLPAKYLAEQRDVAAQLNYTYSHTLPKYPHPTDQGQSGRCWLFSALNGIRLQMIVQHNLPLDFELSSAYLFFYDKLERMNFLLEEMINLRNSDYNDPLVAGLLGTNCPIDDGGTWDFFKNLILKYGIVPRSNYDECFNTMDTSEMNNVLRQKLAQATAEFRQCTTQGTSEEKLRKLKDKVFMPQVYQLLVNFMGEPPSQFKWQYYAHVDGHGEHREQQNQPVMTPIEFFHDIINPSYKIENKVCIIHDPRPSTKLYQTLTLEHFSNMVGGMPNQLVPVKLAEMKEALVNTVKAGQGSWIACDVGQSFAPHRATLATELFDLDTTLNNNISMDKCSELETRRSLPTHAMLLVGVNIDENTNQPDRWRIENSWGWTGVPEDPGYLMMTDQWFDHYMYYAVVDRDCLPDKTRSAIDKHSDKIVKLPFTDPFGAVALLS